MKSKIILFFITVVIFFFHACKNNKAEIENLVTNYPKDVEAIMINKCATAGCHSEASYQGAGGLNLSSWDKLLEGSRSGAVVIPYRPDFSTLCYYTNIDTNKGLTLKPTMPYNASPLTEIEYFVLKNWVLNGASNKNGFVKFSDYENKSKLYVSNRGCDVVAVIDPVSGLVMRYVDVGNHVNIEGPCMIKVSPDKLYWYVIFTQGTIIQKFRTSDNVKVAELNIGTGIWSTLCIFNDSKKAFISDADISGRILCVDLDAMQIITTYQSGFIKPSGLCINQADSKLYVTEMDGNYIYKIDISNLLAPIIQEISLETNVPVSSSPSLNPYAIILNNDETKYFITCIKSSELRVMQVSNDSLIATYPTASNPTDMIFSDSHLFIVCLGVPGTSKKSVINVFDYSSKVFLPEIYAGHDSKGIIIDEETNKLFIANRNVSAGGPATHHEPICEGKNGYLTAINLNTLKLISTFKVELSVDPYYIAK